MARYLVSGLLLAGAALADFTVPGVIKAATTDSGLEACITAEAAIDYCTDNIPGWRTKEASMAACLCCSSTVYMPDVFDDFAATCASYIKTALPRSSTQYTAYSELATFCEVEGNVCKGLGGTTTRGTTTTTTSARTTATTTAKSSSHTSTTTTSTTAQTGQGSSSGASSTTGPTAVTVTVTPTTSASVTPTANAGSEYPQALTWPAGAIAAFLSFVMML